MLKYELEQSVNGDEYCVVLEVWAKRLVVEKIEEEDYPGFYDYFVVADGVRIAFEEEVKIVKTNPAT